MRGGASLHSVSRDIRSVNMISRARRPACSQVGTAHFRVVRMLTFSIDGCDGNTIDRVGVSVEVALIVRSATVPAREDKDASLSTAAVLYAVEHGFGDQAFWRVHAPPVVWRTPAARVDVIILHAVVERRRLVHVRDGPGQYAQTSNARLVRHADAASIVLDRGDLARTACAVLVVRQTRFWQRNVVVEVVRSFGVLEHTNK